MPLRNTVSDERPISFTSDASICIPARKHVFKRSSRVSLYFCMLFYEFL